MERQAEGLPYLERAFPGAAGSMRDGAFTRAEAKALVLDYCATHIPDAVFIGLYGSVATEKQKAYSDIDVLVVVRGEPRNEKCCVMHQGHALEVQVYEERQLEAAFEHAVRARSGYLVDALGLLWPIHDPEGRAESLKASAERLRAQQRGMVGQEGKMHCAIITTLMTDMLTAGGPNERLACAATLYTFVMTSLNQHRTGWYSQPKYALRTLDASDPDLVRRLTNAFRAVAADDKIGPFSEVCQTALDQLGGAVWAGYRGPGFGPVSTPPAPSWSAPAA